MNRKFIGLALACMALTLLVYGMLLSGRGYFGSGIMAMGMSLFLLLGAVVTLRSNSART